MENQHHKAALIGLHPSFTKEMPAWSGEQPPLTETATQALHQGCMWWVEPADGGLKLYDLTDQELRPYLLADLEAPGYRLQRALQERVAKACGVTRFPDLSICDATTGLGRDALILAACGARVTAVERNPLIALRLNRLLNRLPEEGRPELVRADARQWLGKNSYDVVYLDPMFPQRKKSAAVKKGMAFLQNLEEPAPEIEQRALLELARQSSGFRTVVKRPAKAPPLAGQSPSGSLQGKNVRFDFYVNRSLDEINRSASA